MVNRKQFYTKYLLFLFLLSCFLSVSAQDYIPTIQYFTTEHGLSHRDVRCIFQDRDGMMWIATRNGLNRFDGYSFRYWLDKNHGVDLRDIWNIGQDDEGWLWLNKEGTTTFFHPITETFQTIEERFGKNSFLKGYEPGHTLLNPPNDDFGRIYLNKKGLSNIMYRYHSSEGFTTLKFPTKVQTTYIVMGEKEGELYELKQNHQTGSYDYVTYIPDKITPKEITYKAIGEKKSLPFFPQKDNLYQWKESNEQPYEIYNNQQEYLFSLHKNDIKYRYRCTIYDKESRIWVGTDFGFYVVSVKKNQFQFIKAPVKTVQPSARGIWANESNVMVVFEPTLGLATYNWTTNQWNILEQAKNSRAIYSVADNDFWIGAGNQVIHIKDKKAQSYTLDRIQNGDTYGFASWCFAPSHLHKDYLWLGTSSGLYKLDISENSTERLHELPSVTAIDLDIQYISPDATESHLYWLCTDKGLWLFDEKEEKILEKYNWNNKEENYLPSDNFYHLYQDSEGIFWLGTANGIIRWDKKNDEYRQITIEDGLPNNVIYAIYPDSPDSYRDGNLWMSSDYGIIKMNRTTFAIENFLIKDGIGQTEFNRVSHFEYRDQKGHQRLFFGGLNGVTTFYPKDFEKTSTTFQPHLALLKYQQFSGQQQIAIDKTVEIKTTKSIIIPPNDYIYELEVGLLNYENVDNNQYLYQLNDGDWQVQRKRIIQLGQLPYGTHQLKIKAKTINNTPAANVLEYTITVKRPFYLTWWFILLSSIIVTGSSFYFYKRRTTQLKQQQVILEKLVKERTAKIEEDKATIEQQAKELQKLDVLKSRFFANVSHELRTPLTLILGPINTTLKRGDLTNRDFTMLSKAKQSGKNLLKLVGSLLDLSKMEANKMNLNETPTVFFPFIRRIISAFESHAQREGIHFNFENAIDEHLQLKLDKEKLEIIMNNLLSNAIKFTPKGGEVTVNIEDQKNEIKITVTDTGRGIHPDDVPNVFNRFYQSEQENAKTEGGTGIGLALSQEFVELMNGKIWVESKWTIGSEFHVTLPRKEVLGMVEIPKIKEEEEVIEAAVEPISLAKSNKQILIVEDNYSLRDYIQTIIEPHYNIITAANGQIAHDLLTQNHNEQKAQPDLILSDIMMPEMDGYQLLTHLKSTNYLRHIPVIMLTARADIQDKLKALRIGVDDYLLKPFDQEELLTRIVNLLANYEERQAFPRTEIDKTTTTETETLISEGDQKWLQALEELILKEMNNSIFSNEYLADLLHISQQSFYRKVKKLTGLTPNKYIRAIRLQQAKALLENGKSVKETAYNVGFQKVEYFSKLFRKEFGKSPSEYF